MLIIQPNTSVWVLSGVGLDNRYKHTYSVCFKSPTEQFNWFMQKRKKIFTEYTPVRGENSITVSATADNLYDCDYIVFQNYNYSTKYFYAFITDIEWVNVSVCKIKYEIDVIQTWHRVLSAQPTFIERMHAYSDTIGSNIVPENLELGDYIFNGAPVTTEALEGQWKIIIAASVNASGSDAQGGFYAGIYSGLIYHEFSTASAANAFLNKLTGMNKADAVVSIFMFPGTFTDVLGSSTPNQIAIIAPKNTGNLNGYTPKNKKLFTYPYNYLGVLNHMGAMGEYHYELFTSTTCNFKLSMEYSPNATAIMWPLSYKNVGENINEKITMDGIPMCPWTIDAYKAWLAQNGSATSIHNLGTAFSGLASLFSFNIPGAVNAGFSIAESMARQNAISNLPPQAHGATGSGSLLANDMKTFWLCNFCIQSSYARRIDQYFSKYGYAQKAVMTPILNSRKSWNYVETRDMCFKNTGAPADAQRKLEEIYDSGVTFWHVWDIGNYNLDNSLTSSYAELEAQMEAELAEHAAVVQSEILKDPKITSIQGSDNDGSKAPSGNTV